MRTQITRRTVANAMGWGVFGPAFGGTPPLAGIDDQLAALEVLSGARIGVAGVDTGSGATVAYHARERFPLCSTFKLLAVTAIQKRAETEHDLLSRRIKYSRGNLVSYSPVTSTRVETGMSVAELCAAALQYSDNTAANQIIRLLGGPAAVTAYARSIGDEAFRLDRWETALNTAIPGDLRDTSIPHAMMSDLRQAALGATLDRAGRAQLVAWMTGCTTGANRIRAVAPAGSVVADKTGTGDNGTANDFAVIWPPGQAPLVLAVYTTTAKNGAFDSLVAAAAKAALRAFSDQVDAYPALVK